MLRPFKAAAIARSVLAARRPRASRITGMTAAAWASAAPLLLGGVGDGAGRGEPGVSKLLSVGFGGGERLLGPFRNLGALFLGEGGVKVQQERLNVRAKLGGDERNALRHQAGDEMHVTRKPIELRDTRDTPLPLRRAAAKEAASCGRRSSASAPLPVSTSVNSETTLKPSATAKRATAARWALSPRPDRP